MSRQLNYYLNKFPVERSGQKQRREWITCSGRSQSGRASQWSHSLLRESAVDHMWQLLLHHKASQQTSQCFTGHVWHFVCHTFGSVILWPRWPVFTLFYFYLTHNTTKCISLFRVIYQCSINDHKYFENIIWTSSPLKCDACFQYKVQSSCHMVPSDPATVIAGGSLT